MIKLAISSGKIMGVPIWGNASFNYQTPGSDLADLLAPALPRSMVHVNLNIRTSEWTCLS